MKEALRKYTAVVLMFVIVSSVCFLFSCRKSGMFIDEIYTYGLSNSSYAPYITDIKGGDAVGQVITHDELFDYVAITGDEGFDFGSVYYNQSMDVHPPLYYWIFNIVSSFFPNSFTKWTGLVLDYVIYMLTLFFLYKLVMKLFGNRYIASAAVILYGLSLLGMSTMLMIRMYVLLTMLSVLLAWLVACIVRDFKPWLCPLVALTLLLGLLTQYYFVFYAFFLCGAYVIYALVKKQWKPLLWFVPFALGGALCLLLVFPDCLTQLSADKLVSGGNAMDNLKAVDQYAQRLSYYFSQLRHGLKAAIYLTVVAVLAVIVLFKKLRNAAKDNALCLDSLVIILPAFVVLPLVAIISPVMDQRYIYNIVPFFIVAVCLLLYWVDLALGEAKRKDLLRAAALLCVTALALFEAKSAPPEYLYPEYAEYDALVEAVSDEPCVYFTDNYFAPLTQDTIQLLYFNDFYVVDDSCQGMLDYIGDSQEFVAYIDISEYWSSGYDPDEIINKIAELSDYDTATLLYQNGLSATYVISK
jgi:hypothetical protein